MNCGGGAFIFLPPTKSLRRALTYIFSPPRLPSGGEEKKFLFPPGGEISPPFFFPHHTHEGRAFFFHPSFCRGGPFLKKGPPCWENTPPSARAHTTMSPLYRGKRAPCFFSPPKNFLGPPKKFPPCGNPLPQEEGFFKKGAPNIFGSAPPQIKGLEFSPGLKPRGPKLGEIPPFNRENPLAGNF